MASLLDFADENEIEYVKRECARGEIKKEMKNKCVEKVVIEILEHGQVKNLFVEVIINFSL